MVFIIPVLAFQEVALRGNQNSSPHLCLKGRKMQFPSFTVSFSPQEPQSFRMALALLPWFQASSSNTSSLAEKPPRCSHSCSGYVPLAVASEPTLPGQTTETNALSPSHLITATACTAPSQTHTHTHTHTHTRTHTLLSQLSGLFSRKLSYFMCHHPS